jgi:hypothetical protein
VSKETPQEEPQPISEETWKAILEVFPDAEIVEVIDLRERESDDA